MYAHKKNPLLRVFLCAYMMVVDVREGMPKAILGQLCVIVKVPKVRGMG